MGPVVSQLIEEVIVHAQSYSLKDALEICADGTYFLNNLRISWKRIQQGKIKVHFNLKTEIKNHLGNQAKVRR